MPRDGKCEFCNRIRELTEHHLIPVTLHSRKWFKKNFKRSDMRTRKIDLCHDCHLFLHRQYTEKELGRYYNTKEKLLHHPLVMKFIKWISKKR